LNPPRVGTPSCSVQATTRTRAGRVHRAAGAAAAPLARPLQVAEPGVFRDGQRWLAAGVVLTVVVDPVPQSVLVHSNFPGPGFFDHHPSDLFLVFRSGKRSGIPWAGGVRSAGRSRLAGGVS